MTKKQRQLKIKSLVTKETIQSQAELLEKLEAAGIEITQATLSRDCAELGIVRTHTAEGYKFMLPSSLTAVEKPAIRNLIGIEVVSVESNEVMTVIRTVAGRAHGVGSYLDGLQHPDILGTIAGDDTVLVVPKSVRRIAAIERFIQQKISETD
ncbi:MAG: arginine repressor [Rhizobacter sp.]|nr:arginine repressor [Chlorobiales bacterium]